MSPRNSFRSFTFNAKKTFRERRKVVAFEFFSLSFNQDVSQFMVMFECLVSRVTFVPIGKFTFTFLINESNGTRRRNLQALEKRNSFFIQLRKSEDDRKVKGVCMSFIMSNISKGTAFLAQGVTNCLHTEQVEANGHCFALLLFQK